jgi:GNAT superfamily N-acetyltransferase
MTYQITLEEKASAEDIAIIRNGIDRRVGELFPGKSVGTITFFVRDESGTVLGGVTGNYGSFGWLYVDALWVSENLRGQGYGTKLMGMIEGEAARHGCTNVYLNTFTFEAPAFYEKLGYTVFAELEDFPPGHSRLFLRKAIF